MRCENAMKVLEILRLHEMGYSQNKISISVKCARSTVQEVIRRCKEVNLTYEKSQEMLLEEMMLLLYPKAAKKYFKTEPDYESIYKEMQKYPKLNLRFLWTEYKEHNKNGLEYSQFCERFNRWQQKTGKKVTMHQEREPGKELFVDWMGNKLECVVDSETGLLHKAHFFVATLGNSGMPYVEAFPDEKLDKWLLAHIHAIEYYGGIPRIVIPDNCKTAISKPQYYEPQVNPAYWQWARHYEIAVIPARVREPQDKALVEESIGWLETWLLGWLRKQRFFSFAELNNTIQQRVSTLCEHPFQKRPGSRISIFTELDKPELRPLPSHRFEMADFKIRKVPDNYHVEYENFFYSCPYTYYRQQITIRATSTTIEIIDSNHQRIASHLRRYKGKRYVTNPDHMPKKHRKYWESKQWNGERYRSWANNIGEKTGVVIEKLLTAQEIEEQAYKSCMGLLQMSKTFGNERLENACARACNMNSYSYTTVKNILKNGQDLVEQTQTTSKTRAIPIHENIRGNKYYQ